MTQQKRKGTLSPEGSPSKRANTTPCDHSEEQDIRQRPSRTCSTNVDYNHSSSGPKESAIKAYRPTRMSSKLEDEFLSSSFVDRAPPIPSLSADTEIRGSEQKIASTFTKLATEVQEMICAHLSDTQDVVNYMLLSRSTYDTIKRFAYRQIFLNHFDPLEPVVDEDMSYRCHLTYKLRVLCRKEPFCEFAKPKYSRTYSHMIRSVVLQAIGDRTYEYSKVIDNEGTVSSVRTITTRSHNMSYLESNLYEKNGIATTTKFSLESCKMMSSMVKSNKVKSNKVKSDNFSPSGFCRSRDPLPFVLQLSLTHLAWGRKGTSMKPNDLSEAQVVVYQDKNRMPLFKSDTINFKYFLGVVKFLEYHLTNWNGRDGEYALFAGKFLLDDEIPAPRMWAGRMNDVRMQLGCEWTGCYASLDSFQSVMDIRSGSARRQENCVDCFIGEHLPSMTLFWDTKDLPGMSDMMKFADQHVDGRPQWRLPSEGGRKEEGSFPSFQRFFGIGQDNGDAYYLVGTVHPIADMSGISGWKRISFVKSLPNRDESSTYWAYEGIVIPGGEIMMGRWWNPLAGDIGDGGTYCGCWAFWNTDDLDHVPVDIEVAVAFLNDMANA